MIYYLETSALLKRYRTEQGTEIINSLFKNRRPTDVLLTSYFTALEIEVVATRGLKGRILTPEAYRVLLAYFTGDLSQSLMLQPVSDVTLADSITLVKRYGLRAGDAIHLSAALLSGQAASAGIIFVTSDIELSRAAQGEGFDLFDPQHRDAAERLILFQEES
ncbi:MAG: type II toxin-antitoxin system VapC family toxin [Chloroflexi bacterium]|nr:type II toxin-antitoxin system VapC family toxin [Chloroflexota bacterium]